MIKMKRMLVLILGGLVLLAAQMVKVTAQSAGVRYVINFGSGICYHYTMSLPNNLTPSTYSYCGNITIGSAAVRSYPIQCHSSVWFSDTGDYFDHWDIPYFQVQGSNPPVYRPINCDGSNDFIIPANQSATVTFNTGHYYSWFIVVTNEWGIHGGCDITYYLDGEAPDAPSNCTVTNPEKINYGSGYYIKNPVGLSWGASADNPKNQNNIGKSGVKNYKVFDNGVTGIGSITGTSAQFNLSEGVHSLTVKAYDNETYYHSGGNESAASNVMNVTVDRTPPNGIVVINNGNQYTNTHAVNLTLSNVSDGTGSGVYQMCFSNDGITYSNWEPYNSTKSWTLTSGDGTKTVYMKLKDRVGNETSPITDTITLDTIPPAGSVTINNGDTSTDNRQAMLTLSTVDATSGVASMRFSNDGVNYTSEPYNTTKTWTLSDDDGLKQCMSNIRIGPGIPPNQSLRIYIMTPAPPPAVLPSIMERTTPIRRRST